MTRRALYIYGMLVAPLWLHGFGGRVGAQSAVAGSEPVAITLRRDAVIDDTLVSLEQIASLNGGPRALRDRLAKLDVAEFKIGAAHRVVLKEQVRFRLLLAGIDADQVRLAGSERTLITESDAPATFRKIVAAAEQAVRGQYPGDVSQVSLTPGRGIDVPVIAARPGERVRFEARVKTPLPRTGRAMVDVALLVNGKTREVVPVFFDIVEPEQPLAAAPKERSGIRTALYTSPAKNARAVMVKASDNVKIIANIGNARLEALGEALQDGRVGEVIRVRNVESNRVVHGRVEASGMILVDY